jgi:16S rRNA U516 pseudouridylate synthase RsuA-like enzyme
MRLDKTLSDSGYGTRSEVRDLVRVRRAVALEEEVLGQIA